MQRVRQVHLPSRQKEQPRARIERRTFLPTCSLPLLTEKKSATAERWSFVSMRAFSSHTCEARLSRAGPLTMPQTSHPAVDTSAARVDPEEVFEAKILAQHRVDDLDGHLSAPQCERRSQVPRNVDYRDERPALAADCSTRAAGANIIIISHILRAPRQPHTPRAQLRVTCHIKYKLSLYRRKRQA